MFKWLKAKIGPTELTDPVFGTIVYAGGYWEGAGTFTTGDEIEWFVDAPAEGPGEAQHQVFASIGRRYPELFQAVDVVLSRSIAEWEPTALTPLSQHVRLVAISIPAAESPTMEWDMSFESTLPGSPYFIVKLKGWAPTGEVEVST